MINWIYRPSGNCPVQSEGHFMNYYFYFRARWDQATIEFSKTEAGWENNLIHARYVLWKTRNVGSAGWLSHRFCTALVWLGCIRFFFKKNKDQLVNN